MTSVTVAKCWTAREVRVTRQLLATWLTFYMVTVYATIQLHF